MANLMNNCSCCCRGQCCTRWHFTDRDETERSVQKHSRTAAVSIVVWWGDSPSQILCPTPFGSIPCG